MKKVFNFKDNFNKNVQMMLRFLCRAAVLNTGEVISSLDWQREKPRAGCKVSRIVLKMITPSSKMKDEDQLKVDFEGETKP